MARSLVHESFDDISILLIDHDTASVASLTSMLKQFSKRGKEMANLRKTFFFIFIVYIDVDHFFIYIQIFLNCCIVMLKFIICSTIYDDYNYQSLDLVVFA